MTAPLRRPVAYQVAVGRHVPQPDMAFHDDDHAGRSPRFLPGWWLAPSLLISAALWALIVWLILGPMFDHAASEAALAALQAGG